MLEGPEQMKDDAELAVFPSLRDEDLERLGVLAARCTGCTASTSSQSISSTSSSPCGSPANGLGNGVADKDIESKFTALSLAFKTDKMTLGQRLQRQQRQRDLAENNMAAEFTRLLDIQKLLSRATSDAERGDFLDRFRSQLEALDHASKQVSFAAEMYGAVQQEDRLSHAMEVIDVYVETLKRLHQKLCQELEERKRVLAENNIVLEDSQDLAEEPPPRTTRYRSMSALASNPLAGTKRRASIAAIPRPGSLPANGDAAALAKGLVAATQQEARPGRWSAPSRVRRVSLAADQAVADPVATPDRRDSRAEAYVLANATSCMSEITELSESRRESAAEQVDDQVDPNSCLMALGQCGMPPCLAQDEDGPPEHHLYPNGVYRGPPEFAADHMALVAECWCRGRELAVELWLSVSKDSFRWLRPWVVGALLAASLAILITTLLPSARRPASRT